MSWKACEPVWRRGWRCTTFASGSTISSAAPAWPLLTCWDGDLNSHQAFIGGAFAVAYPVVSLASFSLAGTVALAAGVATEFSGSPLLLVQQGRSMIYKAGHET